MEWMGKDFLGAYWSKSQQILRLTPDNADAGTEEHGFEPTALLPTSSFKDKTSTASKTDSFLQRMEEEGRKENSSRKWDHCYWQHQICLTIVILITRENKFTVQLYIMIADSKQKLAIYA